MFENTFFTVLKYIFINLKQITKPNKILDLEGLVEKALKTYFRKIIVISKNKINNLYNAIKRARFIS